MRGFFLKFQCFIFHQTNFCSRSVVKEGGSVRFGEAIGVLVGLD